jgi:hypothetical protein
LLDAEERGEDIARFRGNSKMMSRCKEEKREHNTGCRCRVYIDRWRE